MTTYDLTLKNLTQEQVDIVTSVLFATREVKSHRPVVTRSKENAEHIYAGYETGYISYSAEAGGGSYEAWRWVCSCGRKGRWQGQSYQCCSYAHERHKEKFK